MESEPTSETAKLGWGAVAAGLLLAANIVVPLVWGDVYPFTTGPMFRDAPKRCCNYRVFDPAGRELSAEDWLCQRIYDGNPLGYGVGIRPPDVIEREYGVIHDQVTIRRHFGGILARPEHAELAHVRVVQDVLGPIDAQRVGVVRAIWYRIHRP